MKIRCKNTSFSHKELVIVTICRICFQSFLAGHLQNLGFTSSIGDPDVWMHVATKADGEQHYEYILTYVDDLLSGSANGKAPLEELPKSFKFKNDAIEPPQC